MADVPVYDVSGAQPVIGDMPAENIQAAIASGKFALPKGEVQVLSPEGELGSVPAENAPTAFQSGYKYATPDIIKEATYGTPTEQLKTAAEGAAKSATFGTSPYLEKELLGVPYEEQRARAETNPKVALAGEIGGLFVPGGQGSALAKVSKAIPEMGESIAARAATGATRGAIENAIFQANNETAKWIQQDPTQSAETAAMNVGLAGLIGGGIGGAGGAALGATNKAFDALKGSELSEGLSAFKNQLRTHLGMEPSQPTDIKHIDYKDMFSGPGKQKIETEPTRAQKMGKQFANWVYEKGVSEAGGVAIGEATLPFIGVPHGVAGWLGEKFITPVIAKLMPTIAKPLLNTEVDGAAFKGALSLGRNIIRGENKLNKAAANIFGNADNPIEKPDIESLKKKVNVLSLKPELLLQNDKKSAQLMPDHDAATSMATVRSLQYLSQLRPHRDPTGPLEAARQPSAIEEARYDNALRIAQEPGLILNKVKSGTLTPHDVQDLQAMYPALAQRMNQKVTQELIKHHGSGGTVPYRVKMGIATLTGTPISPTMSGQAILSSQPVAMPQMQQMPAMQKHKNMDKLGKFAQNEMTGAQAAEARHIKS